MEWTDNSDNEDGFKLERSLNSGGSWDSLATVSANDTTHVDTLLTEGTEYCYRVLAFNQFGNSNYSNQICKTTVPNPPILIAADVFGDTLIVLRWQDNSKIEDYFQIERNGVKDYATVPADSTRFFDTNIEEGATYTYVVRACNFPDPPFGLCSPGSNSRDATVSLKAPSECMAQALSHNSIIVTWRDNSAKELGYIIKRSLDGTVNSYQPIDTVGARVEELINEGLNPLTTYYYRVFAYNNDARSDSCVVSATTPASEAIIPQSRVAWAEGSIHTLAWKTGSFIDNIIKIEYSTTAGTAWIVIEDTTANDGCYNWLVPGTPSDQARLRVSDVANPGSYVESELFTIGTPQTPFITATDVTGATGDTVAAEIMIGGNVVPIDAFDFALKFDVNHLSFVRFEKGHLTAAWAVESGRETSPGVVSGGGFHTTPIPAGSNGAIAKVVFKVMASCQPCDVSHLSLQGLGGDIAGLNNYAGTFTCPPLAPHHVSPPLKLTGFPGDTIIVPLMLTYGANPLHSQIRAYGLKLEFPHQFLKFDTTDHRGTLTAGWISSKSQLIADNLVYLEGAGSTAILTSGVFVKVKFVVRAAASGQDTLRLVDFAGDLVGSTTTAGIFQALETSVGEKNKNNMPSDFALSQNYPNPIRISAGGRPLNAEVKIQYQLPVKSRITLKLYDLTGKEVLTLVDEEKPAGVYFAKFDGATLAPGVYFYRLRAGNFSQTRKMILL